MINLEKTILFPTQNFLAFVISSKNMTLTLTYDKKTLSASIQELCHQVFSLTQM